MPRPTALLVAALVLSAASASAQAPPAAPPGTLHWNTSVTEAFEKAKAAKKPVLWVIMKDSEIACERMLSRVYTDAAVIAKTDAFVLIPCSTYSHVAPGADGEAQPGCTQFHGVTCAQHQINDREMRNRYEPNPDVVAPQHIVCAPDGRVVARKKYELKTDGLLEFLDGALTTFKRESGEAVPDAAAKDPAAGAPAGKDLSPAVQRDLRLLVTAPDDERVQAAKNLASSGEPEAHKGLVDALAGPEVKPEALKIRIVRALGAAESGSAAREMARLLDSKSTPLRNAVVVTLEEMENGQAAPPLLELWKKEKDPEIRKDILRALGPAGGGQAPARELLLKELNGKDELNRVASAMALGHHLSGNEEVRTAMKERWRKDNGDLVKTGILYGYLQSKDSALAPDLDALVANEKNAELKELAGIVKSRLTGGGGPPDAGGGGGPPGGGRGGRGGGGGRGGFGGPMMTMFRAFQKLFGPDKVERNVVREMRERWRNR